MSTGFDELLMAVVDYDLEHPEFDKLSDIGDGQKLCSVAADLIHELRRELNEKQDQILELVLEVQDVVNNPPHFWFGDSSEVDGNGEDHEGWLCWEHGDYEAGLPGGWALDGSSPMASYIRGLEERVEKCVYEEDYKELESLNEQLEEELEAHQRSLDYWTEQAENAECRISRQKERIEQLEAVLETISEDGEGNWRAMLARAALYPESVHQQEADHE